MHLRALLGLSVGQQVVFMQGGGTAQFAMVPLLLGRKGVTVEYLHTGYWSGKAIAEARKFADVRVPWSGESRGFRELPRPDEAAFSPEAAYLHYVSNETVEGLRFSERPGVVGVPLVCDMSSDFCSGPIDAGAYDLIYAHAQKNLGPAGVTVAVVDDRLLVDAPDNLPSVLDYRPQIAAGSIYNTPPVLRFTRLCWYCVGCVMRWVDWLPCKRSINGKRSPCIRHWTSLMTAMCRGPACSTAHP
jgi:phosphoserine aminotransferase